MEHGRCEGGGLLPFLRHKPDCNFVRFCGETCSCGLAALLKSHPWRQLQPGEGLAIGQAHELYARGIATLTAATERMEAACGWWPQPEPGPCTLPAKHPGPHSSAPLSDALRFRYNSDTGNFDPPAPSAMLGEAVSLLRRAEVLIGGAGHPRFAGECSAFRTVVERLQCEAETRGATLAPPPPEPPTS